jgi:phospholipid-binding lipoprotein MlaA
MKTYKSKLPLALATLLSLASAPFVSAQDSYLSEEDLFAEEVGASNGGISDPFEPVNRVTFKINDFLYSYVLEPIANGYTAITPDPVERGLTNFYRNLRYPIRLTGNLLQGRFGGAWNETGRFAINSTLGVAGFLPAADRFDSFQQIPAEDVGQALGAWGLGAGPYLVLPLLGPSNFRDFAGFVGDLAVYPIEEPFSMIDHWSWEWKTLIGGVDFVSTSPAAVSRYQRLKGNAIDPYSSLKNGFTQFRAAKIAE